MELAAVEVISGSYEGLPKAIEAFQKNCGARTTFVELSKNQLRQKLWGTLFHHLSDSAHSAIHHNCLSTLRILSRDKTNLEELISEDRLNVILEYAGLRSTNQSEQSYTNVTVESLKLLCNLLFNSPKVQQLLPTTSCLQCIVQRMKTYTRAVPYELMLFDTRILFLITALNIPTRQSVKSDLSGDTCLINLLVDLCGQFEEEEKDAKKEENVTLMCEVLKVLFNLYIHAEDTAADEQEKNKKLVSILHKLLVSKCTTKEDDLQSNIVNLLTVTPYDSCSAVLPAASESSKEVYRNVDMTAVSVLIAFLDRRLNCKEDLIGNLTPVVTTFIRLVKSDKLARKYVRLQILPPLKDVMKRPEEGTTLRAKLCQLLTSPLMELRDLVAEFLFILCKESVSRMVKYTGYGNAAGMFASKGLLGPNRGNASFSSESEDSDTEEYLKHKEQINPVTGCFEPPKPNPLEGMTEEQKEYEALQLVGLVEKLTRAGVVQPCRIGEDGKPKPIEHVLELQEELPKQQYGRQNSDSD